MPQEGSKNRICLKQENRKRHLFFILYNSVISWGCQNINHYQMSNICVHFPSGSVVKNPPAMQEMLVRFLGQEDPLEKEIATHQGFPGGSDGKASAYNAGDPGSIPGLRRSPGEGNGNPPQYSCLENPMDEGAQQSIVHVVAKSRTRLSGFIFTFQYSCLGNPMDRGAWWATVPAWGC